MQNAKYCHKVVCGDIVGVFPRDKGELNRWMNKCRATARACTYDGKLLCVTVIGPGYAFAAHVAHATRSRQRVETSFFIILVVKSLFAGRLPTLG